MDVGLLNHLILETIDGPEPQILHFRHPRNGQMYELELRVIGPCSPTPFREAPSR